MIEDVAEDFDDSGNARKLIWACTCAKGGVAYQRGTEAAGVMLERDVDAHLRERGNERHQVDVGRYFSSAVLDPAPKPLIWHEDES
jgi:hypothetical protein